MWSGNETIKRRTGVQGPEHITLQKQPISSKVTRKGRYHRTIFLDTKNLESHLWQQPPPFSLKRDYLKYFVFVCLGGADCTPYVHHKAS